MRFVNVDLREECVSIVVVVLSYCSTTKALHFGTLSGRGVLFSLLDFNGESQLNWIYEKQFCTIVISKISKLSEIECFSSRIYIGF
jgi:hypothetical protein